MFKTTINDNEDYNEQLETNIIEIIANSGLAVDKNLFFSFREYETVDVDTAYAIAYQWREITKAFLFTTISGLGKLGEKIRELKSLDTHLLSVLHTGFKIISDDMGCSNTLFSNSPPGHQGIHYKWWENSILFPLSNYAGQKQIQLTTASRLLLEKMEFLSKNYIGVTVQLRIVEAIALDICLALMPIFSKVEYQGKQIFKKNDLVWITSHIKAETIHHEQVKNKYSGMSAAAINNKDKKLTLKLTREYADAWADALTSLYNILKRA